MKRVYADPSLGIRKDDFERPSSVPPFNFNCPAIDEDAAVYQQDEF